MKHILNYIKKIVNFDNYQQSLDLIFEKFMDVNYLGCLEIKYSTTDYILKLASRLILYSSKSQLTIFCNIIEAKYKTLLETTKKVVYLWKLLIVIYILFPSKIPKHLSNKSIQFDLNQSSYSKCIQFSSQFSSQL